jgi:glyceraldehyde-3-phosphate dehydrogenase (NADP+)
MAEFERPSMFPAVQDVPPAMALNQKVEQRRFLVNGELVSWAGPQFTVPSPVCLREADGVIRQQSVGSYPMLTRNEASKAIEAASNAFDHGLGEWPKMKAEERIACVEKFTAGMLRNKDAVVKLIMWEIGKTFPDATKEFDRTVKYIQDSVVELRKLMTSSENVVAEEGIVAKVGYKPRGVVLCMGPSNYPLNETFTTLIPALLMGNTVVFKPPKQGVVLFDPLLEAFRDSFPKGVVNTVYGDGKEVIPPIMESGKVDVFAFIGSSFAAEKIAQQHPHRNRLHLILGLGAKNPGIITPEANLDETVAACLDATLSFNGQRCTALKILFAHESISDEFVARLSRAVDDVPVGMSWDKGVKVTPLYEPGKPKFFADLIEDACKASPETRVTNDKGGQIDHTFFHPAVVYPIVPGAKLYKEEQFGPVIAVAKYRDINEVLHYMKESDFSQQASIFGADLEKLAPVVDQLGLLVSRVNINTQCQRGPDSLPFTGTRDSAVGTLSLMDALKEFATERVLAGKLNSKNRAFVEAAALV